MWEKIDSKLDTIIKYKGICFFFDDKGEIVMNFSNRIQKRHKIDIYHLSRKYDFMNEIKYD